MANINNEQRKALARIVEQNGTYSDYYQHKFADTDKKLVADNKATISKHADAVLAKNEAKALFEKEQTALKEKHTTIINKLEKTEKAVRSSLVGKGLMYQEPNRYSYNYEDDEEGKTKKENIVERWSANEGRFTSAYAKWQKELIASIWSSDTVAKAQAVVKEFLAASGRELDIETDED